MKIVSSGRVLNSREFYEKKRKRRRFKVILYFLLFISLVYLFVFLARNEKYFITDVIVSGEDIVDREEMVRVARGVLDGHFLWVLPRANALIYPKRAIKQMLSREFPRLESVDLNLDNERGLIITVMERAPFALYCDNAGPCFFLDETGYIFAPAPSFTDGVYFIYMAEDMVENPIGQRFVTSKEFKSLQSFIEKLKALDINPAILNIEADDYTLILPNNGKIIWRRDGDLNLIQSNLGAFLSSDAIRAQHNFLDRILYLDLRTENKIFYKFK